MSGFESEPIIRCRGPPFVNQPRQLELFPTVDPMDESAESQASAEGRLARVLEETKAVVHRAKELLKGGESLPGGVALKIVDPAPAAVDTPKHDPRPIPRPATPRSEAERLRDAMAEHFADTLLASVTLTQNRSRILSARNGEAGLDVRIHRSFSNAPPQVLGAVADVLLGGKASARRRRGLAVVRKHFENHRPAEPQRTRTLRPIGNHFDLRTLREQVNQRYFEGKIDVAITWGRAPRMKGRRRKDRFSIRLGSYDERAQLVRIHPCLDQSDVPEYVVESVVYHEMLHAAVPPERRGERRSVHTPEFRRRERLYEHHDAANRWLDANLRRLAASR